MKSSYQRTPTHADCAKELARIQYIVQNYQINDTEFPFFYTTLNNILNVLDMLRETPSVKDTKRHLGLVESSLMEKQRRARIG